MPSRTFQKIGYLLIPILILAGCAHHDDDTAAKEAPPAATVVPALDSSLFAVENPAQYPLATAVPREAASQLVVTGTVNPDIARTVPVVTLASGRIVDVRARLGDTVKKGQLLLRVRSDDVSGAYDAYRKAVTDELLTRKQLERDQDLYSHGAIASSDLEIAQDAEDDAKVTLETTTEHLRLLGNDPSNPSGLVDIFAPISGVITDQQITNAAAVQSYSVNPFTISDLSYVWVVCDVYENDIPHLQLGETADIRLNAFPNQVFKGTISNIGAILDPSIRTAKVRLEVRNPGMMKVGMFATATFYGLKKETHTAIPASAIVHLHDRDWVYTPTQDQKFRRLEVSAGAMLPNQMQEILSGVQPNQRVVSNALALQNAIDNE